MASLTIAPPVVSQRFQAPAATRTVLTARGRRVVAALIVALVVAGSYLLSGLLSTMVAAGDSTLPQGKSQIVVVEAGDTLWSIAAEVDPSADPREVVDRIATMNALSADGTLAVGQRLAVPSLG